MSDHAVISVAEMRAIDARSVALGTPIRTLMENAGRAVADAVAARYPVQDVLVLCGPGDNGGDGFVAARLLAERGWPVRVMAFGAREALRGAAADACSACPVPMAPLAADAPVETTLTIDALFGAGLSRPLPPLCADLASRARLVVAVDVPSGVPGDGAAPDGATFRAALTVTFVRKKYAHVLQPGRALCGEIVVADIGAPDQALDGLAFAARENHPDLWALPWPDEASHKHNRGKVAVLAGGDPGMSLTHGAVRLAARAAQRCGAGWVSLFAPAESAFAFSAEPAALVVRQSADSTEIARAHDCLVFGPGAGRSAQTAATAVAVAANAKGAVLDADALSSSADAPDALFAALSPQVVLTPHGGEFARLFADCLGETDKIARTRAAARRAGAVVLHKGADTVIAAPDGRVVVNTHAGPWLATAGTGDVLAGMIAGLMSAGMAPFEAAAAAAWLHGEAGFACGPGLIADDLVAALPTVLNGLAPAALKRR